jgi:transglutaminase-like putative cysteine protease
VRPYSAAVAEFEVHQRYHYAYTAPVSNLTQRLMTVPPDVYGDQRLVSFDVAVAGVPHHQLSWAVDAFGNRVCTINVPRVDQEVEFLTRYRVRRAARGHAIAEFGPQYVLPTPLTQADANLAAVARRIAKHATSVEQRVQHAFGWLARAMTYEVGVTGVHTTAAQALQLGRGVCQDLVHLLLSVLRQMSIPARYVSGHLPGDGAPHAWLEVLVNERVLAYDPTHTREARGNYVIVAVGRDYADVAPTAGVFYGAARGSLTSTRLVRAVGARQSSRSAAA